MIIQMWKNFPYGTPEFSAFLLSTAHPGQPSKYTLGFLSSKGASPSPAILPYRSVSHTLAGHLETIICELERRAAYQKLLAGDVLGA